MKGQEGFLNSSFVTRHSRRGGSMNTLWQDLRYGLRMLWRSPGLTAVVVLSLALGIGASTAIFTLVDSYVFEKFPVENPDRLVALCATRSPEDCPQGFAYPDYQD